MADVETAIVRRKRMMSCDLPSVVRLAEWCFVGFIKEDGRKGPISRKD